MTTKLEKKEAAFDVAPHAGVSSSLKPVGPYTAAGGKVSLPAGINYLEIATANASACCSRQRNKTINNRSKYRGNLRDLDVIHIYIYVYLCICVCVARMEQVRA